MKAYLWFLSLLYSSVVRLRHLFYALNIFKSYSLEVPVICVGNIAIGGVGKTPMVVYVVNHLLEKGLKPAVLIRGYMAGAKKGDKNIDSDEARMLEELLPNVPILVGADRVKSAKAFLGTPDKGECPPVDVFVMDDGFQHFRLKRDLDVVVLDAFSPFGNGHVMPRGILREPISAIKRAGCVVLTKSDLCEDDGKSSAAQVSKIAGDKPVSRASHSPENFRDIKDGKLLDPEWIMGKNAALFCSIGNPQGFRSTVESLEANVKQQIVFEDHHVYQKKDILKINDICLKQGVDVLVTTHKDAVKIMSFKDILDPRLQILVLNISFKIIDGEESVLGRIDSLFDN